MKIKSHSQYIIKIQQKYKSFGHQSITKLSTKYSYWVVTITWLYFWLYRSNPRVKKNTNERYRQLDFCNKNTQTLNVKGFFVCKFSVQFTKAVLPQLVTWVCPLCLCKTECRAIMLYYCGLIWINLLLKVKNPFKYLL